MGRELRLALRRLGRITGAVDFEDLLDVIFHDFCISKETERWYFEYYTLDSESVAFYQHRSFRGFHLISRF